MMLANAIAFVDGEMIYLAKPRGGSLGSIQISRYAPAAVFGWLGALPRCYRQIRNVQMTTADSSAAIGALE